MCDGNNHDGQWIGLDSEEEISLNFCLFGEDDLFSSHFDHHIEQATTTINRMFSSIHLLETQDRRCDIG